MSLSRDRVAVAISTTGAEHRLGFLETCVAHWDRVLRMGDSLFVTVDGTPGDQRNVERAVSQYTSAVFRVGAPVEGYIPNRLGVAANKNTGLELMMDNTKARHLFLSDDDTWPLYPQSLTKHIDLPLAHSMVCWGKSRLHKVDKAFASWHWPRGVVLYQTRQVVETIGGMDERFGAGGHEHAEYSQRIHNAHLTPYAYPTPASYATRDAMGARALWHCEDMIKPGEPRHEHDSRRRAFTTIKRERADWKRINAIMEQRQGSSDYVAFRAHDNGRASATLSPT